MAVTSPVGYPEGMNDLSQQWSNECMEALQQANVAWLCDRVTNPPSHPRLPSPGLACLMAMLYTRGLVAFQSLREGGEDTLIAALVDPAHPQEIPVEVWRGFAKSWGWEGRYLSGLGERLAQMPWYLESMQAWLSQPGEKEWLLDQLLNTHHVNHWASTNEDIVRLMPAPDRLRFANEQLRAFGAPDSKAGFEFQVPVFSKLSAWEGVDASSWAAWWRHHLGDAPSLTGLKAHGLVTAVNHHVATRGTLPPGVEWDEDFFRGWGRLLAENAKAANVVVCSVQTPQGDSKLLKVNEAFFVDALLKTLSWPEKSSIAPAELVLAGAREVWPNLEADLDKKSENKALSNPEAWAAWRDWRLHQKLEAVAPSRRPRM